MPSYGRGMLEAEHDVFLLNVSSGGCRAKKSNGEDEGELRNDQSISQSVSRRNSPDNIYHHKL